MQISKFPRFFFQLYIINVDPRVNSRRLESSSG
nr:MAG TPA: hypothetical protein [Bacteriophage sp.]